MEPQKWEFGNIYYSYPLRVECKMIFSSVYAQGPSTPVNDWFSREAGAAEWYIVIDKVYLSWLSPGSWRRWLLISVVKVQKKMDANLQLSF